MKEFIQKNLICINDDEWDDMSKTHRISSETSLKIKSMYHSSILLLHVRNGTRHSVVHYILYTVKLK